MLGHAPGTCPVAIQAKGLLIGMEWIALSLNGCQVVLRSAAADWPSAQAARRRMAAIEGQPGGPELLTRLAASSFSCVLAYAPSLFLAKRVSNSGATRSMPINRPS
jgi:hypothetical protein